MTQFPVPGPACGDMPHDADEPPVPQHVAAAGGAVPEAVAGAAVRHGLDTTGQGQDNASAYGPAVAEAHVTCPSHPHQVVGRLWDGSAFYFRERSGTAAVAFGPTWQAACEDVMAGLGTEADSPVLVPGPAAENAVRRLLEEHIETVLKPS